ncbi:MAG: FIST N-terminal domain-containing protein [Planctomycetota bacterium]
MKVELIQVRPDCQLVTREAGGREANLLLVFGSTAGLDNPRLYPSLKAAFPKAIVFGCSTAGEILGTRVADDSVVAAAVRFDRVHVRAARAALGEVGDAFQAGVRLAKALAGNDLAHILVLSEGIQVNGTKLVAGLTSALPPGVAVTGGLSGDGTRFGRTLVMLDGPAESGIIAAVGLYGKSLRVGYASLGGWDSFGTERLITRSNENTLFELDGMPALDLYKSYLGDRAAELPAAGLLFPLSVTLPGSVAPVVRTLLAIDEKARSLTFAGDVPEGSFARLMKANFDRLVEGAIGAAKVSQTSPSCGAPELALLISCVGRKLVLKQRVEEEVEGVRAVLGDRPSLIGFYSYGEISPFTPAARCELHNQTMTITTLGEA